MLPPPPSRQLKNPSSGTEEVVYLTTEEQKNQNHFKDKEAGVDLEIVAKENITDFFAEHYKQWGCTIEFVTNRSQEGSQFCRGFGGIGGMLRWKVCAPGTRNVPPLAPRPSLSLYFYAFLSFQLTSSTVHECCSREAWQVCTIPPLLFSSWYLFFRTDGLCSNGNGSGDRHKGCGRGR